MKKLQILIDALKHGIETEKQLTEIQTLLKPTMKNELKIYKNRVLSAAESCPDAKGILKELFLNVLKTKI